MTRIERTAMVNHSAEEMFDLVNDIEQYPKFLPGCADARVINRSDEQLVGELTLSKAGVSQKLVTRNLLDRPSSIRMELVEGNFSAFDAHWTFTPINENACRVSLIMEFKFKSSLLGFAAEKLFSAVANSQVDAIVKRARQVYG
ncbi:MAG: type II toxin-antitoxin system RatA family toxin [Pseudohongiellaceae bacterium]|jgi:ribosome-associated toxin RatA of RatAB toxin-antitoxin module